MNTGGSMNKVKIIKGKRHPKPQPIVENLLTLLEKDFRDDQKHIDSKKLEERARYINKLKRLY